MSSLVFVPKIKDSYRPCELNLDKNPTFIYNPWSAKDLKRLVRLRAMNVSHIKIGSMLKRSASSCGYVVHGYKLGIEINQLKKKLINDIMESDE